MTLRLLFFALALIGALALGQKAGHAQTDQSPARNAGSDGQTNFYVQGTGPTAATRTPVRLAPRTGRSGNPRANPASNSVDSATTR
jgi:hypothetical protein